MFTLEVPQNLNKDDVRFYKITQAVYLFCIFIHSINSIIFYYFDVMEMFFFNIFFSIPVFTLAFYLNKKSHLNLAFLLASIELILHQVGTVYYIGWEAGVQYYLIFISVLMFFNHKWNIKVQLLHVFLIVTIYTVLYIFYRDHVIYVLPEKVYYAVNIFVVVLTIFSIVLLINYFVKGAYRSERELEILVRRRTKELEKSQSDAIYMLGEAGHHNDNNTSVHIWRMADYAALLAKNYGCSKKEVKLLKLAAPMHDTGKIGISDYILQKESSLNEKEWEEMKKHCELGHKILSKSKSKLFEYAASIALNHHEKWDGSGYPNGLKEKEIPLEARIVSIADVFDALTMKRPYKNPWDSDEAFEYIKERSGKAFDPLLVEVFLSSKDEVLKIKEYWAKKEEFQKSSRL